MEKRQDVDIPDLTSVDIPWSTMEKSFKKNLDSTFGTDAVTILRHAGNDKVSEVLIQPDGSILSVGTIDRFNEWNEQNISLVRLLTDGSPDTQFGSDGGVLIDLGKAESGYGVALQTDGKILIVGDALAPFNRDAIILRTSSTGEIDTTFGLNGIASISFGGDYEQFNDLVLQPDGTIVVTGNSGAEGNRDFIVAKVLSNRSLDPTFDCDGKVVHSFDGDEAAWTLAVLTNGRLLLTGEKDWDWTLFRLLHMDTNQVPVMNPVGDQSLAEGKTLELGITAADLENDPLVFTLSGEPNFVSLLNHGDSTAMLRLTPGFDDASVYPGVTIIVSDDIDKDAVTITITVEKMEYLFLHLVLSRND